MATPQKSQLASLESFLEGPPHIPHLTSSSPEFPAVSASFIVNNATPLAIVRPQKASDVAALIEFATSNDIKFAVRSGGHDLFGRSKVEGALMIDMRDIRHVEIDQTRMAARIGGGTVASHLAYELSQHGFITAFGTVPDVGYVGWATLGGYGPFSAKYGLGVDQIISAKIINWEGKLVDADGGMLKGIRGAGGNFGVIVELEIKIYPEPKVLAGEILFHSGDINKTFRTFSEGYRDLEMEMNLPESLNLVVQPFVHNDPVHGKVFGVEFCWSGPQQDDSALQLGQSWIQTIANLGSLFKNTVKEISAPAWLDQHAVPKGLYGGPRTLSIRNLTDQIIAIIGRQLEIMPEDPATGFSFHQLRGSSASPNAESVFGAREPHFVLELLATTENKANMDKSLAWADGFRNELLQSNADALLSGEYTPLSFPGAVSVSQLYGSQYQALLNLKHKYDPKDVFNQAVPRLGNH